MKKKTKNYSIKRRNHANIYSIVERVLPLTVHQVAQLFDIIDKTALPLRILANGLAVNLITRVCSSKGSNIIYHPMYWDRSKEWENKVMEFMQENNPNVKFRITYH